MNIEINATGRSADPSLETVMENWKDMVFNTALSIVQHKEDAEDITQDVFVQIFQQWAIFRKESGIKTWIYRITVNKCLDHIRKKKRQKSGGLLKRIFGNTAEEETIEFEHPGVLAEKKEQSVQLFKALQALPESQKIVFVLHKIEGLNQGEIADILGITRMAVESKIKRAKNNLFEKLKLMYERP